ncbi:MAG: CHAT domain-containing protein [Limisphaerales bacterium]
MPANPYLDFDLRIRREGDGYCAEVIQSPAGTGRHLFVNPFSDLELENYLLKIGQRASGMRRADTPESRAAREFGSRLYEAVFQGDLHGCFRSSCDAAKRREAGLRVRLWLGEVPELADLPWEYLYQPQQRQFLALSKETPLVRHLELSDVKTPLAVKPPLRALVVVATPEDQDPLNVQHEVQKLRDAVKDLEERNLLVLELLPAPTLDALQRQLRKGDYHIFHFIGHGAFDPNSQESVLLFEDDRKRSHPVSGHDLGVYLRDEPTLRLAILNACEGARAARNDPFAGVAQGLVLKGVPAVIAMQFAVSDAAAITFAHGFYSALADGLPVDASLGEARKSIFAKGNAVEWGTPVLYLNAPDGRIFDVDTSGVETTATHIGRLLENARAGQKDGDWTKCAAKAEAALALAPDHAEAKALLAAALRARETEKLFAEGVSHAEAGRWEGAVAAFERVEKELPGFKDTAARLKQARLKLEDARRGPPPVGPEKPEPKRPEPRPPGPENIIPLPPPPKKRGLLLPIAAIFVLGAIIAGLVFSGAFKPGRGPAPSPSPGPQAVLTGWKVIALDGKEHGPVALDELRQWITERRVAAKSLVRELPDGEWKTIESDGALASYLPAPPPAQPEPERVQPVPDPKAGLAKTEVLDPRQDAAPAAGGWYFQDEKGVEQGPYSNGAMRAMIGAGQIDEDTMVKAPGMDRYRAASRFDELSSALNLAAGAGATSPDNALNDLAAKAQAQLTELDAKVNALEQKSQEQPVRNLRDNAGDNAPPFSPTGWWRLRMTENVRLSGLRTEAEGYVYFEAFGNFTYTAQVSAGPFAGAPMMLQGAWSYDPPSRALELRHGMIDGSINIIQSTVTGSGDSFRANGSSMVGTYTFEFQRGTPPADQGANTQQLLDLIRQLGR